MEDSISLAFTLYPIQTETKQNKEKPETYNNWENNLLLRLEICAIENLHFKKWKHF